MIIVIHGRRASGKTTIGRLIEKTLTAVGMRVLRLDYPHEFPPSHGRYHVIILEVETPEGLYSFDDGCIGNLSPSGSHIAHPLVMRKLPLARKKDWYYYASWLTKLLNIRCSK